MADSENYFYRIWEKSIAKLQKIIYVENSEISFLRNIQVKVNGIRKITMNQQYTPFNYCVEIELVNGKWSEFNKFVKILEKYQKEILNFFVDEKGYGICASISIKGPQIG